MELDKAIAHAEEVAELNENMAHLDPESPELDQSCLKCAAEHRQLAAWLRELKGLRLMLDWMVECNFGYDNIPDVYEKYKLDIEKMGYTEGLIYCATREANSEG